MGILVDPIEYSPSHLSEEILEKYVFHRLPEGLTAPLEEHLLVCHRCQDAVAEIDEFVADLKVAANQCAPQPAGSWVSALHSLANRPSLAPVVALVILALVVVWKQPQETSTPVAVSLSSLRGLSPLAPAPAGKPLRLIIDVPDLVSAGKYRAELVDAAGSPVWKGAVSAVDGKLTATMSKPLRNGVYWVRLYGADSELLREFGLSAK
jgi:anti-sigma factor RsiW